MAHAGSHTSDARGDEATFFRVIAGDQQFPRTQPRRRRDCRLVVRDPGLGLEAKDLRIEHFDAGVGEPALDFAQERRVAHDVVLRLGRRDRQQTDADMAEPRRGGTSHQFGGRQFEHRERRERDGSGHVFGPFRAAHGPTLVIKTPKNISIATSRWALAARRRAVRRL